MTIPERRLLFYSTDSGINVYYLKLTYEVQPPDPVYDFEDLNGVVLEPMTLFTLHLKQVPREKELKTNQ